MTQSTSSSESFQLSLTAAELYESAFVPGFFAQWAPVLCQAAGLRPGHRVLDVACGTGIVARVAADRVAPDGEVVGVDLNEHMLTVARRVVASVEFRRGDAGDLPFPGERFDAVMSQMALMFFPDRARALSEMARVAAPSGTVALLVPGALASQEAFGAFVQVASRHVGAEGASLLSTYFRCGDLDRLTGEVASAGLRVTTSRTELGTYRAPSVDAFVTTEVESTPLAERISAEVYDRLRADAHAALAAYTKPDGSVEAPFVANVVVAQS